MTTFLIYTYKNDAEMLIVTLKQLLSLSQSARIVVIDDAHRPMSRTHCDAIRALGCIVEHSTHFRNGNLLGHDHTLYHAEKMKELASGPDDIVVKLDPDTVLFDLSWIEAFKHDSDALLAGAYKVHISYIMGMAYAVKGVILDAYLDDVRRYPSWLRSFEDFEVSSRIYRLTDRDPYAAHRFNVSDGWVHCNYAESAQIRPLLASCKVFNGGAIPDKSNIPAQAGHLAFVKKLIDMRKPAQKEGPCTTKQ